MNHCFPEHDLATLFIHDRVAAEVTAEADDARPLVASIGRLSPVNPEERDAQMPLISAPLAKRVIGVVGVVATFIIHGSEWGDPCDLCEFADRDPFQAADRDVTRIRRSSDQASPTP